LRCPEHAHFQWRSKAWRFCHLNQKWLFCNPLLWKHKRSMMSGQLKSADIDLWLDPTPLETKLENDYWMKVKRDLFKTCTRLLVSYSRSHSIWEKWLKPVNQARTNNLYHWKDVIDHKQRCCVPLTNTSISLLLLEYQRSPKNRLSLEECQ